MTPSEYIMTLVVLVYGLSVAELFRGVHFVFSNSTRVKLDWLTLVLAAWVLYAITVGFWLSFTFWDGRTGDTRIWEFLYTMVISLTVFVAARGCLPHRFDPGEFSIDLKDHYESQRRLLYFALFVNTGGFALAVALVMLLQYEVNAENFAVLAEVSIGPAVFLTLYIINSRRIQAMLLIAFFLLTVVTTINRPLTLVLG